MAGEVGEMGENPKYHYLGAEGVLRNKSSNPALGGCWRTTSYRIVSSMAGHVTIMTTRAGMM